MTDGFIMTAAQAPFFIANYEALKSESAADALSGIGARGQPYSPSYGYWVVYWLVNALQWSLIATTGQSLGKMLLGTRIVRFEDDGPAGLFRGVVLRVWLLIAILYVLPPVMRIGVYFIDVCWIFFLPSRCLHDFVSGTRVIAVRTPDEDS